MMTEPNSPAVECRLDGGVRPLVAKLRYMGRQYAAGQYARGGGQQKHYLEEAADELERLHELADSEGTRAVEYLRRARRAEAALRALADAADAVGVRHFDTDTVDLDVGAMQSATLEAREVLKRPNARVQPLP